KKQKILLPTQTCSEFKAAASSASYGFVWPMRVASINGKQYVLVIADDYSRYTWVHFLRTKDETPKVIKKFLKKIYVRLQAPVIIVHTDNRTEFKNHALKEYFDSVGITHETTAAKTSQQNGFVERRNYTLVETARTMLIFSHAPLFLWAEEITTACERIPKKDKIRSKLDKNEKRGEAEKSQKQLQTEFKNHALKEYFDSVGITHETTAAKTSQQNGFVERRNYTLVETARTMLIFSHAPLFLWAEEITTACYTQNHSIIH
nr:putative ribonuclease H-like domain-containing protein [Tanacetum cinerariifolium]